MLTMLQTPWDPQHLTTLYVSMLQGIAWHVANPSPSEDNVTNHANITISIKVSSIATEMFFYLLQSHSPQHVVGPKHVVVNVIVINKKHFSCD
jgi:hypothetical protein